MTRMLRRCVVSVSVVAGCAVISQVSPSSQTPAFDLVIRGGRLVDGTGNPWFFADVGIKGDSITTVAPHLDAADGRSVIDASGLVVAPGFIDVHSHVEARDDGQDLIGNPTAENNVRRILIGGTEDNVSFFRAQLPKAWRSLSLTVMSV